VAAAPTNGHDCSGFDEATVEFEVGATDITVDGKVQESDDDGVADAYADIPGAAVTQFSATDDNKIKAISINMMGRKKFLKPIMTVGDGSVGAICAVRVRLSKAGQQPTAHGYAQLVEV
jgi:hypothetical protein